jgi:hypothetical protein
VHAPALGESRTFVAPDGVRWEARIIAHGPASGYLAARVSRATVQFTRLEAPAGPPRYAALAAPTLAALDEAALAALWRRARIH